MDNEALKQELELKKQELRVQMEVCAANIAQIDATISVLDNMGKPNPSGFEEVKVRDAIEFAIKAAPDQFSLSDIENLIYIRFPSSKFPKSTIASTFWRIAQERNFSVIHGGLGNRPTVYQKATPSLNGRILNEENWILSVLNGPNGLGKTAAQIASEINIPAAKVSEVLRRRPEMFSEGADHLWRQKR